MLSLSTDLAASCWLTINWINSQTITIVSRSIYQYEIWITTLTSDSAITIEARWYNVGDHSQMLTLRVLIYVKAKQRLGNEMESGLFDTNCSCSEKTWQKFRFTMLFYIVGCPTIHSHQRVDSFIAVYRKQRNKLFPALVSFWVLKKHKTNGKIIPLFVYNDNTYI